MSDSPGRMHAEPPGTTIERLAGLRAEVQRLHDALARERSRCTELEHRAELLEQALRGSYQLAITPRRRD